MNCRVFIFLLLVLDGFTSIKLFANSIQSFDVQDKTIVLDDGLKLFWKNIYDKDFSVTTGFYANDNVWFKRIINGANDTIYMNSQLGRIIQVENFWFDDAYYQLRRINLSTSNWTEYFQCKNYDKDEHRWAIYNKAADGNWQVGSEYCINKHLFYDISEKGNDDSSLIALCLFFIIYIAYSVIFPYWNCEKYEDYIWIWWLIGFLLSLGIALFIGSYWQRQLFLPLFVIISTSILFKIPRYIGKVRYISQCLIGLIIVVFFTYKQFFDINDTIEFEDGKELNIRWENGTCLIKRCYIKQIFSNMIPIKVKSREKEYVLYISKYEFSEDDFSVVVDEPLNWLNVLFKFNRSCDNLSFRESQIILELLKKNTNTQFDFLSYEEWKSVSPYQNHSPNNLNFGDVDEVDNNGLVNIRGNMPEYTSNYYNGNYRLGLAADTLIRSYNNVVVVGSAYESMDSINLSVVNKNIRDGFVGFRLVYRPDNVGARTFFIKGHLRSDKKHINLPSKIKLVSIDNYYVKDLNNYESFEELLIECRFKNKTIKAVDLSNNKEFSFLHPMGLEYYDFEPQFSFVGL